MSSSILPFLNGVRQINPTAVAGWAAAVLTILVAHSGAELTWMLWPVAPDEAPRAVTASGGQPAGLPARTGLDAIARLHLFGRAEEKRPLAQVPVSAPETRLSLTLRGVVASGNPAHAAAIIASGSGPDDFYKVGATVPGGAVIHEIRPEKVILQRGGRFETLTLPKDGVDGVVSQAPTRMDDVRGGGAAPVATELRQYREKILSNPQSAMDLARVQPVMEGGQLKGYRLSPNKDPRLFQGVGLRPGDVVTHVNGISLNDPARLGEVWGELTQSGRFDLTVERGGRETTLSINLE